MAKQDNITTLLQEGLQLVKQQVISKYKDIVDKELTLRKNKNKELFKINKEIDKVNKEYNKLDDEISLLEVKLNKMRDNRFQLGEEISHLQGKANSFYPSSGKSHLLGDIVYGYSTTLNELQLDVINDLDSTPEANNIRAYKSIEAKFNQLMTISLTQKEKRSILLQFYSIDWESLGILLPIDKNIGDIKITNGVINVGNKTLGN